MTWERVWQEVNTPPAGGSPMRLDDGNTMSQQEAAEAASFEAFAAQVGV